MVSKKVFISYSRKEFYFAEHLATLLKSKYGLEAWFDIHELQVGMDWSISIQQALEGCDALVLIASRASLGSPYVRVEWEAVLKANKPVIVVFFEAVDLPPELANVPLIDLRGNFERGVEQFVKALNTPDQSLEGMTKSEVMTKSPRFPLPMWLVIAGYLSPVALLFVIGLWTVPVIIAGGLLLRSFLRRSYRLSEHRSAFLLLLIGAVIVMMLTVLDQDVNNFQIAPYLPLIVVCGTVALLALASLWMLANHAALFRWLPTGQGSQAVRERINRAIRQPTRLQFADLGKLYRLHFENADQRVAQDVRTVLNAAYYHEATLDAPVIDHEIVVVSNRTPVDVMQAVDDAHRELITVVATAFEVPESAKDLSRYQWIDYRKRDQQALKNMVEDMYLRDTGGANLQYALMPVPESFTRVLLPSRIDTIVQTLNLIGGFGLVMGLNALITVLTYQPLDVYNRPVEFNAWNNTVLALACFALLWLAQQIRQREMRFLPALLVGIAAMPISMITAYNLGWYADTLSSVMLCVSLIGLLMFMNGAMALRHWLLPNRLGGGSARVLANREPRRLLWIAAALTILIISANFVIAFIREG